MRVVLLSCTSRLKSPTRTCLVLYLASSEYSRESGLSGVVLGSIQVPVVTGGSVANGKQILTEDDA